MPALSRIDRALYRALLPLAVSLDTSLLPCRAAAALTSAPQPPCLPQPTPAALPSALAHLRACFRSPAAVAPPAPAATAAPLPPPQRAAALAAQDGLSALRAVNGWLAGVGGAPPLPRGALLRCLGAPTALPHAPLPPARDAQLVAPSPALPPGTLLLARPGLPWPFERAVVLLLHHSAEGAVGVTLSALGPAAGGASLLQPPLPHLAQGAAPAAAAAAAALPRLRLVYDSAGLPPMQEAASTLPKRYQEALEACSHGSGAAPPPHPCASATWHTPEQRFWASAAVQFTRCNAEGALGALRAAGLAVFPHTSGLKAMVELPGRSGTMEVALLPLGPGLDAPAPPWVQAAQDAWVAPVAWAAGGGAGGLGGSGGADSAALAAAEPRPCALQDAPSGHSRRSVSERRLAAASGGGRRWFGRRAAGVLISVVGEGMEGQPPAGTEFDARAGGSSRAAFAEPQWSDSETYDSSDEERGEAAALRVKGVAEEESEAAGLISELRNTLSELAKSADGPRGWRHRRAARRLSDLTEPQVEEGTDRAEEEGGRKGEEGLSEEDSEEDSEEEDGVEEEEGEEEEEEVDSAFQRAPSNSSASFPCAGTTWGASAASPLRADAVARSARCTPEVALLALEFSFPGALRTPSQAGLVALCRGTGRLHLLGAAARALSPSEARALGRQLQAAAVAHWGGQGRPGSSSSSSTAAIAASPPALYGGPVPTRIYSLQQQCSMSGAAAAAGGMPLSVTWGGAGEGSKAGAPCAPGAPDQLLGRRRRGAARRGLAAAPAPAHPSLGLTLHPHLHLRAWVPGQAQLGEVHFGSMASWAPGQLDGELREKAWCTASVEDMWGVVAQGCRARMAPGGCSGDELWRDVMQRLGGLHALAAAAEARGPSALH